MSEVSRRCPYCKEVPYRAGGEHPIAVHSCKAGGPEAVIESLSRWQSRPIEDALTSALISMVQQYLYRPLDNKTREPAENVYQHDFMSAGEEACNVLVEMGLAEWTDDDHYAITLKGGAG